MKKLFYFLFLIGASSLAAAQELYVFSEPASNMPANTLSTKISAGFGKNNGTVQQRFIPELMWGISKKFMVHLGNSFSNMHTGNTRWESIYLYTKYRFLSLDDVHRHFRMALFTDLNYSRNRYHYDEVNLQGDRSGAQLGLIATQLLNKLAVSGTISHTQALDRARFDKDEGITDGIYQSLNYSLSAGYLVLPREYRDYKQTNMNLYLEFLGQRTLDRKTYYVDLAPALQLIFNSNTKLNMGYRFQLDGDQKRGMTKGFLVSFEHTFFDVINKN